MFTRLKQRKPPFYAVLFLILVVLKFDSILTAEPDLKLTYNASANFIEFFVENENYFISNVSCKGIKGVKNGSRNNICENLEPCSTYLATVTVNPINEDDQSGVLDQILDVNTTYATPQVQVVDIIPNIVSIYMKWEAKNPTCILRFEINVKSENWEFKNELTNENTNIEIDSLQPCSDYDIQLKTTDVRMEVIGAPIEETARTDYAEPEEVTDIEFEMAGNGEVKVTWEPPKYKTCIRYFFLKWATLECIEKMSQNRRSALPAVNVIREVTNPPDDECKWTFKNISETNTKQFVIKNLDGCEDYGLVFLINKENTALRPAVNEFKTSEQIPGLIVYGEHQINSTEIKVVWSIKENKKCVKVFNVEITGPLQLQFEEQIKVQSSTSETYETFFELFPCGIYNVSVQPIGLNDTGGVKINTTIIANEDNPTKIQNVVVGTAPKALLIQWDAPSFGVLCLEGYRVTSWIDNSNTSVFYKQVTETEVEIEDLVSCQAYTVQIVPFTKSKDGVFEHIEQITAPIVAAAPNPFQEIASHSHSLELSARSKEEDYSTNKCQTLFARFVCETEQKVPFKKAVQYVEGRLGDVSFKATMQPLSPFTKYSCKVDLYNTAGWSDISIHIFNTDKYYPEQPINVYAKEISTNSIKFQWEPPIYPNGNINVYMLYFRYMQAAYYIPSYCKVDTPDPKSPETSQLENSFDNLEPFTYYSVQIAAKNEFGAGEFSIPLLERTLPSVSEPVTELKVISIVGPDVNSTTFKANVVLSWLMPCKLNGEIKALILEFNGSRDDHESVQFIREVLPSYDEKGLMLFNETQLSPEYNYEVGVSVVIDSVNTTSKPVVINFQAPAGIPEKLQDISLAKVDAFEAKNPTTSAVVRFPVSLLTTESGTILYAALLLSEKNCNSNPELLVGALDTNVEWPDSSSWTESYSKDACIRQYQTTPIRWQPIQPRSGDFSDKSNNYVEYTIGTESCSNITKRYCNGPLKADTQYQMVLRLFTKSSFSDTAVLEFKTDALINVFLIWVSIISCLMIAFMAGFLYLYITKKIMWHRESGHGIEDSFGDITSKNFAIFYDDVSKRDKLQREFKELTVIASDFSFLASETNEYKNRYRDIFPYDKNRVILDVDADGNDYINASFINGYRRKKEYIATQGPKQESIVDFWRMVLQHNVKIIVMVTQFKEEDVVKCHQYYPYEWKSIKVEIRNEDFFDLYDRREIIVTHSQQNIRRKVIHFYFKKWPDHGVPTDPMSLITFVRKVKAEKCPSDSPIVVHCSAGVGRTGTFIGLDIIMQRIKSESKINIFETVKELRFQRMKMVQSMQQYTFLYVCAFELVKHKRGKYIANNKKKVSFENDGDTILGEVPKVSVMDTDAENSSETKNFESVI